MKDFGLRTHLPVVAPYRLDLTAEALRRLAANVVDVVRDDGTYVRALGDERGVNVVAVAQASGDALDVRIDGNHAKRWLPSVERMLGTAVDVTAWHERVAALPWLHRIARELTGLRPPRYPDLWEALAHAIVFQQISIHAAAAIMRRLVQTLSEPVAYEDLQLYPFPRPHALLVCDEAALRAAGLSANKVAHLRSAAIALRDGTVSDAQIEGLSTVDAVEALCSVRGIGPWSAAVVLLRGFGRLDIFPMRDSGVARSIRLLSGDPEISIEAVLDTLGPARGMLYFHLLLGRLRNLVPVAPDSEPA